MVRAWWLEAASFSPATHDPYEMANVPDGIVTVHLDENRYRGAYYFRDDEIVVTAYGLRQKSVNAGVLSGERGDAALNLAKLVLIDMVREVVDVKGLDPGLSLQGSTTTALYLP